MESESCLAGRTVLVTGGARRVGAAIATSLACRGARVIVHYRSSREAAEALAATLGGGTFAVSADLAEPDGPAALVASCRDRGATPDVLVHAASTFLRRPPLDTTPDEWDQVFAINLRSFYLLGREIVVAGDAGATAGAGTGVRGGDLIAIADVAAHELWPNYLAHSVSKAALLALVKGLAKSLAPAWRVNAVVPGTVLPADDTSPEVMAGLERRTLVGRIGEPDDVARAVEFLLATPFATGSTVEVTGGSELWRGR